MLTPEDDHPERSHPPQHSSRGKPDMPRYLILIDLHKLLRLKIEKDKKAFETELDYIYIYYIYIISLRLSRWTVFNIWWWKWWTNNQNDHNFYCNLPESAQNRQIPIIFISTFFYVRYISCHHVQHNMVPPKNPSPKSSRNFWNSNTQLQLQQDSPAAIDNCAEGPKATMGQTSGIVTHLRWSHRPLLTRMTIHRGGLGNRNLM